MTTEANTHPRHTVEIYHQRCGHTASWQFSGPNLTAKLAASIADILGRKRPCHVCQDPDEALVS